MATYAGSHKVLDRSSIAQANSYYDNFANGNVHADRTLLTLVMVR
jgi:hypothetical protein